MRTIFPLVATIAIAACSKSEAPPQTVQEVVAPALTAGDREALRSLDQNIAKAWLEQGSEAQSRALLSLFAPDAVVYPCTGGAPLSGTEALRAFWFPEGDPPTRVEYFERRATDIEGSRALGAITGRSERAFTHRGARTVREDHYIIHARPDADGYWKIERMMWSDQPAL